jgi:hypothetical protein
MSEDKTQVIRSSDAAWFSQVLVAYDKRTPFKFEDDAELGIDLEKQSLAQIGLRGRLAAQDWMAAFSSIGVSAFGGYMVIAAIIDPEPTSKLGLMVAAGSALVMSGSFTAVRVLTRIKPPSVKVTKGWIEVRWDD